MVARIKLTLQDGQQLGYIKMQEGKPYYGYSWSEATQFADEAEARKICQKFSDSYICYIVIPKREKPKAGKINVIYE